MLAWSRSWKGGTVVAAAWSVIGVVRVASAEHGWLTWILFPLAAVVGLVLVFQDGRIEGHRTPAAPGQGHHQPASGSDD